MCPIFFLESNKEVIENANRHLAGKRDETKYSILFFFSCIYPLGNFHTTMSCLIQNKEYEELKKQISINDRINKSSSQVIAYLLMKNDPNEN